jgi:hypothetical protein
MYVCMYVYIYEIEGESSITALLWPDSLCVYIYICMYIYIIYMYIYIYMYVCMFVCIYIYRR